MGNFEWGERRRCNRGQRGGDRQDVGGPERAGWRADCDLPTTHPPSATALTNPNLALHP